MPKPFRREMIEMSRREFVLALGSAAVARPLAAHAQQQSGKTYRIGYLTGGPEEGVRRLYLPAFSRGMRDLGYIEGTNFSIEGRFADGKLELLSSLARELLSLDPDVLLVATTPAVLAAKGATSTTPIVMVAVADPVGAGLIASLARPGENITGVTNIGAELAGKRLEILKEIVPRASRVAVLLNPNDPIAPSQMRGAETAAKNLSIALAPVLEIRGIDDLKRAFEAISRARPHAAIRMIDYWEAALRRQTVALAAQHRLPIIFPFREAVELGGLVSYGTSLSDQYRQTAAYVHKILTGAKPADLPVEQASKFELVVNLKTAKALGLTMPRSLLARADGVIE